MSFLTPLFIAGIAAVALPILFHMIRRTPRGRIPFSTVMFLEPSPPRMTRRSRLENWPLLLLRALALTLLAIAFARPFWREAIGVGVDKNAGKQIAILIDTSASMRRGNLWKHAVSRALRILDRADAGDQIGLFTFDRRLTAVVPFAEATTLEVSARRKIIRQRLSEISPGWAATDLADALTGTADLLNAADANQTGKQNARSREIILISDMQSGSRTESLSNYQWPADVRLIVEQVTAAKKTNAGLQLAAADDKAPGDVESIRVRVVNAADSQREQFRLRWSGDGPFFVDAQPIEVYVPPGESRIVRIPLSENLHLPAKLTLTGDDHDFDNTIAVDRPATQALTVLCIGSGDPGDSQQPLYYLQHAFPDNRRRRVTVINQKPDAPLISPDAREIGLVIVTEPLPDEQLAAFRHYVEEGGTLLFAGSSPGVCRDFGKCIGKPKLQVREADVEGYAMLGNIDFEHPLFALFDDARFSDFTSIHFWRHRRLDTRDLDGCQILARFDDGSPAVIASSTGLGTALLLTSGWHPADSQLARSTKFVPLMNAMLELSVGRLNELPHYTIGDRVQIVKHADAALIPSSVRLPDNRSIRLASGQNTFAKTDVPGIYRLGETADVPRFTVNLAAEESNTAPMPLEKLEALGVRLAASSTPISRAATAARERQLKSIELENQQKIWRWLILAALAVLVLETWLAGRLARRQAAPV